MGRDKNGISITVFLPDELQARIIRRVAQEMMDCGKRVSTSEVVRKAIVFYLDKWEKENR